MTPELQDLETLRDKLAKLAAMRPSGDYIALRHFHVLNLHAFAHRACELAYERLDVMAEVIQREQERQMQKEEEERQEAEKNPF